MMLVFVALALLLTASCSNDDPDPERPADNIILIIGDGMGPAHVEAGRIYRKGAAKLTFEGLAEHARMITSSLNAVVTDSAASASAIATGQLVNNYAVSMTHDGRELRTIFDHARDLGMATGLVTTDAIDSATPSAFVAHTPLRFSSSEIIEQMVMPGGPDVMLGGGVNWSRACIATAEDNGFRIVVDADSMNALPHTTDRVTLGLFEGSVVPLPGVEASTRVEPAGCEPPPMEAGSPATDSGAVETDAGTVVVEGGTLEMEGGTLEMEGGGLEMDGSMLGTDASVLETDGSLLEMDGGMLETNGGFDASSDDGEVDADDTEEPVVVENTDEVFLNRALVSYTQKLLTPPLARDGSQSDPTLPQMTQWALDELEGRGTGFILVVETEHTDELSHVMGSSKRHADALMPYLVSAVAELDETVELVLDWVDEQEDPNRTLIIVAADHETCGLIIDRSQTGKGTVVDATCSVGDSHSALPVDVFAQGAGVDLSDVEENTHIFRLMTRALGLYEAGMRDAGM